MRTTLIILLTKIWLFCICQHTCHYSAPADLFIYLLSPTDMLSLSAPADRLRINQHLKTCLVDLKCDIRLFWKALPTIWGFSQFFARRFLIFEFLPYIMRCIFKEVFFNLRKSDCEYTEQLCEHCHHIQ